MSSKDTVSLLNEKLDEFQMVDCDKACRQNKKVNVTAQSFGLMREGVAISKYR